MRLVVIGMEKGREVEKEKEEKEKKETIKHHTSRFPPPSSLCRAMKRKNGENKKEKFATKFAFFHLFLSLLLLLLFGEIIILSA